MKPVICFEMLYMQLQSHEKIARIAEAGFSSIEFWGWRDKNLEELKKACDANGVEVANFSGHRRGSLIAAETHDLLLADLRDTVQAAESLDCPTLMLLSNEVGNEGQVTNRYQELSDEQKYRNMVDGLTKALSVIPESMKLVLEPLNTRVDHPGYYLDDAETAFSLVKEINHPRMKILCDLYHLGVMGEDLEAIVEQNIEQIGYFHIADFPGRHEPGTGSANWVSLLARINSTGYRGPVGFEYSPAGDTKTSLETIQELWGRAVG